MDDRSKAISRLRSDLNARTSYIRAKLAVLVPSQIKALRLKSEMPRQSDLANAAQMHQSRISMFETPGAANMTIDTLSRLAATFNTGLIIEFVPFSEMLGWENDFSQDSFNVTRLDHDRDFLEGLARPRARHKRKSTAVTATGFAVSIGANLLWSQVAEKPQLELFASESLADSGREISTLSDLLSRGGIPDGRQSYNPDTSATEATKERAVA